MTDEILKQPKNKNEKFQILHNFHNNLQFGHQGINKTLKAILLHYY